MSQKSLKKLLDALGKEELVSLLLGIVSLRRENAEWLEVKLKGNSTEALEYFKKKIYARISNAEKPGLKEARKLVLGFTKITENPEFLLELMVFYVETGIRTEEKYGVLYEGFYASMENMFSEAVKELGKKENVLLKEKFKPRLDWIIEHAAEGWGHKQGKIFKKGEEWHERSPWVCGTYWNRFE